MDIAFLNVRVTFQKNEVVVDDIGNHTSKWSDYYHCHEVIVTAQQRTNLRSGGR